MEVERRDESRRVTTIHPETQIVASSFDKFSRICSYTYEHADGSRYTVEVHIDDLQKRGNKVIPKIERRRNIAMRIANHVATNAPDER